MSYISQDVAGGRRRGTARRALLALAAAALLAGSGCGFEPINAQRSQASPAALAQIEIAPIKDRIGQMLRNELLTAFRPRGGNGTRYVLTVSLIESLQDLGVRKDTVATRANLTLIATFAISPVGGGEPLTGGTVRSINSYNILTSDFATLSARADARERAVRELSQRIKERASIWLHQTGGNAVPRADAPASPAAPAR